jgi:hypothetical protein
MKERGTIGFVCKLFQSAVYKIKSVGKMYRERIDVRTGAAPWVLKIEFGDGEIMALRYQDFNRCLEFMNLVDDYFGKEVRLCLMSNIEFKTQALERGHEEWIDLIEDVEDAEMEF